jgi:hypothetical protein
MYSKNNSDKGINEIKAKACRPEFQSLSEQKPEQREIFLLMLQEYK